MLIQPFIPNMDISRTVLEGEWESIWIDTAQKIAIYTLLPMMLIIAFEAILKNLLFFNLANAIITVINQGYELYLLLKERALDCLGT